MSELTQRIAAAARPSTDAGPLARPCEDSILVVDTDRVSLETSAATLAGAGYDVRTAVGWSTAAALIECDPPDVIVISAAVLSPLGTLQWAQRLKGGSSRSGIAVILLASEGIDVDILAGIESSFDGFLFKPIRPEELLLRVLVVTRMRSHQLLRRKRRELRGEQARMWTVLLEFARSMSRVRDLDTILEQLVMSAAQMTCSRRVSLMMPDETHRSLVIANAIGIDEEVRRHGRFPIGDSVAGQAYRTGRIVTSLDGQPESAESRDYRGEQFVSMPIDAPSIKAGVERLGVLNMTDRFGDRPYQEWEIEFIDLLGSIASSSIDDAVWQRTRDSLLKMEHDLQIARRIQQSTFPRELPVLDGFEIATWSEPADETAGDTYDVIPCGAAGEGGRAGTDRTMLLLADATGHGIGPALSVIQVRAMLRMACRLEQALPRIVHDMNEQLCADLPSGRFVTTWLGDLDVPSRTLTSFSAGQAPILLYRARRGEVERLDADTLPLGIVADLEVTPAAPIRIEPGDLLAVISDGVFEALDADGEQFGVQRVSTILTTHRADSPSGILRTLRDSLEVFTGGAPASDDRTAVIVKGVP